MALDLVHDIQRAYRKVLNAMTRPGVVENISKEGRKVAIYEAAFKATFTLMHMFLDPEVKYKIVSTKEEKMTKLMKQLTYAKASLLEESDFIFILKDATSATREESIRRAKKGCLINPHQSATIVIEVEKISSDKNLIFRGPGIENHHYATIDVEGNWIVERDKKNREYPMGVDIIFIDEASNIIGLPRTTQIIK